MFLTHYFQSARAAASSKKPGKLANPIQNKHALSRPRVLFFRSTVYLFFSFFSEIAQVIAACKTVTAEQLNVTPGQLILVLHKNSCGWWLGELQVCVSTYTIVKHIFQRKPQLIGRLCCVLCRRLGVRSVKRAGFTPQMSGCWSPTV